MQRNGILFIISAPSGAGKTTLCREVIRECTGLKVSISYTTRKPRQGEINGVHYFFVDEATFKTMISNGEFAEWASVHGNLYGTSKSRIDEMVMEGFDVLLDIDVQGGVQVKRDRPESVLIFILPPSIKILKERLIKRMSDSENEIARRMVRARDEISEYKHYDYVIVNETLEDAVLKLKSVIIAERASITRANHEWIARNFLEENV